MAFNTRYDFIVNIGDSVTTRILPRGKKFRITTAMRDALSRLWSDIGEGMVEATERTAKPSRGTTRVRGPWPVDSGDSLRAFGSESDDDTIAVTNTTRYAKAIERGAYYERTNWTRPRGQHMPWVWGKHVKKYADEIATKELPEELKPTFKKARVRRRKARVA